MAHVLALIDRGEMVKPEAPNRFVASDGRTLYATTEMNARKRTYFAHIFNRYVISHMSLCTCPYAL